MEWSNKYESILWIIIIKAKALENKSQGSGSEFINKLECSDLVKNELKKCLNVKNIQDIKLTFT